MINSLVFIRFIAALIVINFHYGKNIFGLEHFYSTGQQMVTFFFVLSGFVLGLSYIHRTYIDYRKFIVSRVIKIAPLYFVGLILSVLMFYLSGKYIDLQGLVYNILFIQALVPSYSLTFNYPAWFISTQMVLYLLFPFLILWHKRFNLSTTKWFVAVILFWFISQIVLIAILSSDYENKILIRDIVYYHPLSHLCSFILGIVGGIWFVNKKADITSYTNSTLVVIITFAILIFVLEYYRVLQALIMYQIPFGASFFAIIFLAFVLSLASFGNQRIFSNPIMLLLGNASFAIYILHAPIHMAFEEFFGLDMKSLMDFTIYVCATIIIGIVAFIYIEKKLATYIKARI